MLHHYNFIIYRVLLLRLLVAELRVATFLDVPLKFISPALIDPIRGGRVVLAEFK